MSKMLKKFTFYQSNLFFVFDSLWTHNIFQIPNQQEKTDFSKHFWHGLLQSYKKFNTIPIRMFNLKS